MMQASLSPAAWAVNVGAMERTIIVYRWFLIALDVCLGICLLFWPGVWHELLHGAVERTTFFVLHAAGLMFITRGVASVFMNPSTPRLYALTAPAVFYLAWTTAGTSAWALPVYSALGLLWLIGEGGRMYPAQSPMESAPGSTGVDFT